MLRYILTSFLAGLLTACGTAPSAPGTSSRESSSGQTSASGEQLDAIAQSLIGYAASDFGRHSQAVTQVRNVRLGHVSTAEGNKQYFLCGEFMPALGERKGEWTPFATIRTDPYEQWLGMQAATWCRHAEVKWEANRGDLSSVLASRLGSLK